MRRLLSFLLLSFTLCLWIAHLPAVNWHIAAAVSFNGSQLVKGVNLYQTGNFKGAIASWQTALQFYQKTKNHSKAAIVQENLAEVYEQIGDSREAIERWEEAIAYYRQIKDRP